MANRFDVCRLDATTKPVAGGGRLIDARPTRIGVFKYNDGKGGTRSELRHPDDVFDAESVASLAYAPVTDLHPATMVTAATRRRDAVGFVTTPSAAEPFIAAPIVVDHQPTIDAIDAGKRKELSCGYSCDLIPESGTYDGKHYTHRQRNIRYNHVAIGPEGWGRLGPTAALRLDADDAISGYTGSEQPMAFKIKVGSVEYEVADANAAAAINGHIDSQQKRIDTLTGRADTLDAEVKRLGAIDINAAVKSRVELIDSARTVLGASAKLDGNDREIRIAVVKHMDQSFDPTGKSDDYITARYDSVMVIAKSSASSNQPAFYNADSRAGANGVGDPDAAFKKLHTDSAACTGFGNPYGK